MSSQTILKNTSYIGCPPVFHNEYAVGCQRLEDVVEEIRPVHETHYREIETNYLDQPFEPGYDRYVHLEQNGQFVLFTVRQNSTIVGYLQYYISRDMHAEGMYTAREDAFYLLPEVRGQGLAPVVLDFAEHFLQKLGCKYVGMTDKSPVGGAAIGSFLEKRDYREIAIYYMKEL
jgi:GNAT superfamily N-acetyltransferase